MPGYVKVELRFPPAGAGVVIVVLESGSRTERIGRGGMRYAWVRAAEAARRRMGAIVVCFCVSFCGWGFGFLVGDWEVRWV